jgi:hypothetical protein
LQDDHSRRAAGTQEQPAPRLVAKSFPEAEHVAVETLRAAEIAL